MGAAIPSLPPPPRHVPGVMQTILTGVHLFCGVALVCMDRTLCVSACACMWTSKDSCVHVWNYMRHHSVLRVVLYISAIAGERKKCVYVCVCVCVCVCARLCVYVCVCVCVCQRCLANRL